MTGFPISRVWKRNLDTDMRCRWKRTHSRDGMGRFGMRFWAIMGTMSLIECIRWSWYGMAIAVVLNKAGVCLDSRKKNFGSIAAFLLIQQTEGISLTPISNILIFRKTDPQYKSMLLMEYKFYMFCTSSFSFSESSSIENGFWIKPWAPASMISCAGPSIE